MSALPVFLLNELVFNDSSMATSLTSAILDLGEATGYACHFVWSGTPVGSVVTSGSNFLDDLNSFTEVDSQLTASAAGNHLLNVERCHYRYIQISYERTSGTGTLKARVSAKRS